jgi:signal transduction histidine kinase/DNA-binding NarL/FixJ family response regulator
LGDLQNHPANYLTMTRLKIGTKILLVIGLVFILFTLGLALLIVSTSFNNLTQIKQAELERTSQILASRVGQMEQNAVLAVLSFEQNEPIVSELQLLTLLGPYYADPGSYFEAEFINSGPIENADKVYVLQAQLNLIQLLQSTQQINNFSSIRYYHLSPFEIVPGAQPVAAFQLEQRNIVLTQFNRKSDVRDRLVYAIATDQFRPPPPGYFDISSAYSGPVDSFYADNRLELTDEIQLRAIFSKDWQGVTEPRSEIVVEAGVPVLQTWYPVRIPMPHPITWEEEAVPVGVALVEQRLGPDVIGLLANQLGLDVGFAQDNQLLISSIYGVNGAVELEKQDTVTFNEQPFNYAWQTIELADEPTSLQAVVLSPVSELEQLTGAQRDQIVNLALLTVVIVSVIVYVSLQYLLNRPLRALMNGVELISSGDLSQEVPFQSQDEVGQLALAFNGMAGQLRELINSLEQRVAARTHRLETVAELGEQLNALLEVDRILNALVEQVKANFDYSLAQVYLVDERSQTLALAAAASRNGDTAVTPQKTSISLADPGLVAKAAATGEIVRLGDVRFGANWLTNDTQADTYMEMAVPIIAEDRVLGVLDVQKNETTGLDEADANMLRSLANYVAVAINNARLFEQVQQRATELAEAHQAAEDARQKAESANQAKSEFLSNISHELRTPLNGILGYTQVLRDGEALTEAQATSVGVIEQSGEHLLTLINDILDLAKIEAKKMELVYGDIYLPQFLDGLVRIFRIRSEKKRLIFHYELAASLTYTIRVDEKRLRQIVINLLSNAIRFTERGRVDFRVSVLATAVDESAQERVVLRFEVVDTGVGLNQADIEKIFAPFEQAGEIQEMHVGTGLGLAISQNLARMMGSQIEVESVPGSGSRFWFDLSVPLISRRPEPTQEEGPKIIGYQGLVRKILVIDDELYNRDLIVQMLSPLGFDVFTAVGGREILPQVAAIQPHLILMDLKMPEIGGLEATRIIREAMGGDGRSLTPLNHDVIIIAASASAFDTDRDASEQAGCDGFLPKPIKREVLLHLLESHLGLDWIYEVNSKTSDDSGQATVAEFVVPSVDEMAVLLDLAKSGKLRRILDQADYLSQLDASYEPFALKLRELAETFQEKKLLSFIEEQAKPVEDEAISEAEPHSTIE